MEKPGEKDGDDPSGNDWSARPRGPSWRLEARQASADWDNPLQSHRGILRDTLAGEWILPGRGEGNLISRAHFPVAACGSWNAATQGTAGASWSLAQSLLRESGNLGVSQTWGAWTHEAGASLAWRRKGLTGASTNAARAEDPGGEAGTTEMDWGQSLLWRRGGWKAKCAFTWKGDGYAGSRPVPFSLEGAEYGRRGAFSAALLTGDIRNPGSYLRADLRQVWEAGERVRVEQEIRLPWTPEGLAADMGYQLRLEAAL